MEEPATKPVDPITGWDLGSGRVVRLPVERPAEILLFRAHPEAFTGPTPSAQAYVNVWGLDPKLTVCITVYKRLRLGKDPLDGPFMDSQITGSLQAFPLVLTGNRLVTNLALPEIPPDDIFRFGGGLYDGCELSSAMQGIQILATAHLLGPCDHELVATIQVKPNVALGCVELAEKLIATMRVEFEPPVSFITG